MRNILVLVALLLPLTLTACNDPNADRLKQTLQVLDEAGYDIDLDVDGELSPTAYLKEEAGLGGYLRFKGRAIKRRDSKFSSADAAAVDPKGTTVVE